MIYQAKYIILDERLPIIFPEMMTHADVAQALGHHRVTSAGFVNINKEGKYNAYGESFSLSIKSTPEDSALINRALGNSHMD